MSDWKTLTSIALLGTDRAAAEYPLPAAVEDLMPPGAPAETRLLRASGTLSLLQATVPGAAAEADLPTPAPEESSVVVSNRELVDLLRTILEEGNSALIREACALLAGRDALLPPALIPAALEHGRKLKVLREPVQKVIGKRGAWLAAQNDAWKFSAAADAEESDPVIWETGILAQRQAYLRLLHSQDPRVALIKMRAAFPAESAANRVALLGEIVPSLVAEDVPFLEELLANDRSKEVKSVAAAALSALPESDFAKRMAARLAPLVALDAKTEKLRLEPPAEFTPDMAKDAIEQKVPHSGIGERAWWLQQIVGYTPLSWWQAHLGEEPAQILFLAQKTKWMKPVLSGLREAIDRQPGHPDWAQALMDTRSLPLDEYLTLAQSLSPDQAQRAHLHVLDTAKDVEDTLYRLVHSQEAEFSPTLWAAILERLPGLLAGRDWRFREVLKALPLKIPVSALHQEVQLQDSQLFTEAIAEFLRLLDQRRALHRLIANASI